MNVMLKLMQCYIHIILLVLNLPRQSRAFTSTVPRLHVPSISRRFSNKKDESDSPGNIFDTYLEENALTKAVAVFRQNPQLELTKERFVAVFDSIERRTSEAEEINDDRSSIMRSSSRLEMTSMYRTLKDLDHLKLFGASKDFPPASGSHIVTPKLLEAVSGLSMVALTPKPTNSVLVAGVALALFEGVISLNLGIDFNLLVFITLALSLFDQSMMNGAFFESFIKAFSPGMQTRIVKHEAGHFLTAYLLGLPVEGCVLSAWEAMKDTRFNNGETSAATSFYDPELSEQINNSVLKRSSIDRYSVVVMAGIAAEAINYGRADGGAGDEMALVSFLSQLNGNSQQGSNTAWNNLTIRNQARWGALQAVLLLREYRVCYDALVGALERGCSLGDCIFAIEEAGQKKRAEAHEGTTGIYS
mmetsp:Transcript_2093/g.2376  ORF Transcript_2093/g.2376 Transcript_2093/m.2376 type:complete len:417 (-) Transcript_2093:220-1470(-)